MGFSALFQGEGWRAGERAENREEGAGRKSVERARDQIADSKEEREKRDRE
jgi:hypothetical protein